MATPRKPRFVVGIDLGTTNSAVAATPASGQAPIEIFPVAQLVAPGEASALPLLPSAVYLPAEGELAAGATRLPWGDEPSYVVGELAKRQGAKVPGRLAASAKSWLSFAGVDRTAPILPWGAPAGVPKLSPVEASARIVGQIRAAWDAAHPDAPLAEQEVILTVPASFDEAARELTVGAAREAGLPRIRLLEEPQAAFYDFLNQHPDDLGAALAGARLVLVVDVGGGTTDLTLVRVDALPAGPPRLTRIAVGEHLMLGGDNMDAALARHVEAKLQGQTGKLDAAQWSALVQACRLAKENLLADPARAQQEATVTLVSRGARLIGGAQSYRLGKGEAEAILLDGFLPKTGADEVPSRARRAAFTELGLPYAADPAISRHVAAFLRRHVQAAAETGVPVVDGLPRPDAVLLNGGVFNGPAVMARLAEVLAGWFSGERIPLLSHASLDLAVARGAAHYGLVRRGFGVKIAGGAARAYYVGVEGEGGRRMACCVVPRGLEEGTEVEADGRVFRLVLGRPVSFPLLSSTLARAESPGDVVPVDDDLVPLPPLVTVLRTEGREPPAEVPVKIRAGLTEIGTLELSLSTTEGFRRRWRLEFSVRGEGAEGGGGGAAVAPIDELPRRFDEAKAALELSFGKKALPVEAREVKNLWRSLEKIIGDRDGWSSAVNRELWGIVWGGAQKRRRTADHERVWFQLAGFTLRPGFGAPLDEWRAGELWKLFDGGVQYTTLKPNWAEWWVLWRRVAGGLDAGRQQRILEVARPWLKPPEGRSPPRPKGPKVEALEELVRLVASLERLPAADKAEVGRWVLHRIDARLGAPSWWALGRLGARQPFYGSAHDTVPRDVAVAWLGRLLEQDLKRADGAAFAVAQLARRTGDRERDLPDDLREAAARRLEAGGAPDGWVRMTREILELSAQDEMRVFGDTLPAGLRLA
jgi:hypothetical protein